MGNSSYSPNLTTTINTLSRTVTQSSHGFSVGNWLKITGTDTYALAKGDSAADAAVAGVVTSVIDTNNFVLTVHGYATGLSGLTAGTVYYLDPSTAGGMTSIQPVTAGQVDKCIFIATSTTAGYVLNQRGLLQFVAAGASHAPGLVPDPGASAHTPPYLLGEDAAFHQQGWAKLARTVVSGTPGSVDFFGLTGFQTYAFDVQNLVPVTNSVDLWIRYSYDGSTFDTNSYYNYAWTYATFSSGGGLVGGINQTKGVPMTSILNSTNIGTNGFYVLNPGSSSSRTTMTGTTISWQGASQVTMSSYGEMQGHTFSNGAVGVRFMFASGNIAEGTITVYGKS